MSLPSFKDVFAGYKAVDGSNGRSETPRVSEAPPSGSSSCPNVATTSFRTVGTGTAPGTSPKKRTEMIVGSKFRVLQKLGKGSFGVIRLGLNILNGESVAIKLEEIDQSNRMLQWEYNVYKHLHEGRTPPVGIPRALYYGATTFGYNALVLDLMGPNLEDLLLICGKRFTLKTVLILADQMISRLEMLHSKGYVHRDMKPENFVMGTGRNTAKVFLIDFGLSKKYLTTARKHVREIVAEKSNPPGTVRFVTLNAHNGKQLCRRDDLESLGLMMIYLLRGSLPWDDALENQRGYSRDQAYEIIKKCKQSVTIEKLCEGYPAPFAQYFQYCRKLNFDEKPNYFFLRKKFRYLAIQRGYLFQDEFDWSEMQEGKLDWEWRNFVAEKVAAEITTPATAAATGNAANVGAEEWN